MKLGILLLLVSSLSFSASVSLFVKLSPAGSFEAITREINGRVIYKGGKLKSKRILVAVDSLKTGIDLRDEHLKKYLRHIKNPYIYMHDLKGENNRGTGMLEVCGVKKKIIFIYKVKGKSLEADFSIDTKSFNLSKIKYFNIGVNEIVKIKVIIPIKNQELM